MRNVFYLVLAVAMLTACTRTPANDNAASKDQTPKVYLTREITPQALVDIYKALGVPAKGRVAIKMSTGEGSNPNYL